MAVIKLAVFRALSRFYIARILRLATVVVLSLSFLFVLITWALAHYFSPWWWLLLVLLLGFLIAFLVIRTVTTLISRLIYPDKVTPQQAAGIRAFIDKFNRLLEVRSINPAMIAIVSLKDFVMYRELRTLKEMIDDSQSIQSDFKRLNDRF